MLWTCLALLIVCEPEQIPAPQPTTSYHVLDLIADTAARVMADRLLQSDPETPVPFCPERVLQAAQDLAVGWELLDPRERNYRLRDIAERQADFDTIRTRRLQCGDAPLASDVERFPDRYQVSHLLDFNRQYRYYLVARNPNWGRCPVIDETDQLYHTWDTLRDARADYSYVTVRRTALMKLRDLLGDEAYYATRMPPHVPVWRFRETP